MDAPGSLSYCDFVNHCYIDYIYFIINFMYVLEAVGLAFISLTLQIVSITGVVATVWDCNLYQPINTARSKADRVEDLRISPDRGDPKGFLQTEETLVKIGLDRSPLPQLASDRDVIESSCDPKP